MGARLIHIQKDGSYGDHVKKFLKYSALSPNMAESTFMDAFVMGLSPELRAEVVSRHPKKKDECMREAQLVNDHKNLALNELGLQGANTMKAQLTKAPIPQMEKSELKDKETQTRQITLNTRGNFVKKEAGEASTKRLSDSELQMRIDKGLYFRCNDKWSQGHWGKMRENRELRLYITNVKVELEEEGEVKTEANEIVELKNYGARRQCGNLLEVLTWFFRQRGHKTEGKNKRDRW